MGERPPDQPTPEVPPPPPRQPDEALKGYLERRNKSSPSSEGSDTAPPGG